MAATVPVHSKFATTTDEIVDLMDLVDAGWLGFYYPG